MCRPRILIVDDDDLVRSSVARILRGRFDVILAGNGAEAIVVIENGGNFDVILTDVEMPIMDGRALVERLGKTNSTLSDRVLVMTGGPRDTGLAAWVGKLAVDRVVAKPLATDKLLDAIEAILRGQFLQIGP